jgi:hypothetical protein
LVIEMQLTPEQQEQMRQAKAVGERRVTLEFTPDQRRAYQKAVEQELAGKAENIVQGHKIVAAAEQPGFFGDVRRAIMLSQRSIGELATEINVEPRVLSDFRAGDAELPALVLDRLIETLGLRLMQEIPR